jgi:hypothetical protein
VVDDDDALAQVLHDVLRELREIRHVHLLATYGGFRVAQPPRHGPGEQRDEEDDASQDSRARIVARVRGSGEVAANLLGEQRERRERGEQEGIAAVREQRHRAHRHDEQDAHAASHTAARQQDEADGHRIDHGVHERRCTQVGQQAPASHDNGDAGREIHDAGPEEQGGAQGADRRGRAEVEIERVERRRDQQPVEIDQPDHAPGEIGRDRRSGSD